MKRVNLLLFFLCLLLADLSAGSDITGASDKTLTVLYPENWPVADLKDNLGRGYRSRMILEIRKQKKRFFPWRKLTNDRDSVFRVTRTVQQDVLTGFYTVITETDSESTNAEFEKLQDAVYEFSHFYMADYAQFYGSDFEFRFILEPVILKSPLNMITLFMSNQYKSSWTDIPRGFFLEK